MTRSLSRSALALFTLGFAPATHARAIATSGFVGQWRGKANLPASMSIEGVELRLAVRNNGHATSLVLVSWTTGASAKVRGRGWIYASGRCSKWSENEAQARVVVHTIARLSTAAAQVTFDLYLPDGSELFGYATLQERFATVETSF